MAKKKEVNPDADAGVTTAVVTQPAVSKVATPTPAFTDEAFGLYKDAKTGDWTIALIKYNPLTGDTQKVIPTKPDKYRPMAIERFKLLVSDMLYRD